jgi:hypothetical protein
MHVLISFVTTCRPLSHFKDINLCLNYIFGTDQEKKKKRQTLDGEVAIPISSHLPDFLLPSSPLLPYLLSLFFFTQANPNLFVSSASPDPSVVLHLPLAWVRAASVSSLFSLFGSPKYMQQLWARVRAVTP